MNYPEFKPETRRWMFWLARIFGVRRVGSNDDTTVTFYYWRGRYWVWNEEHPTAKAARGGK